MEKIEEIKKLRAQLPEKWVWNKCYELGYFNSRTGREFVKKHWALTAPDGKGLVCSLGLISHDCYSNKKEFLNDISVQWVEKSLEIIDYLLSEVDRLSNPSEFGLVKKDEWISVKDRLPTREDAFDDYDEVLTVQIGRKRPTMMKYWEIKHCPFTTFWMSVPQLPPQTLNEYEK